MARRPDLDDLIDRWRGPLVGLLRAWGVREPIELAQEVFVQAWLGHQRYHGDWEKGADVGPWLRGIAWNLCAAEGRRAARRPRALEEAPDPSGHDAPDVELEERERAERVRAAIDALPADQRAAVWMVYLERVPIDDVAGMLGVPKSTVHGRLFRARRALAPALETLVTERSAR